MQKRVSLPALFALDFLLIGFLEELDLITYGPSKF
jgi:hypothetical protein